MRKGSGRVTVLCNPLPEIPGDEMEGENRSILSIRGLPRVALEGMITDGALAAGALEVVELRRLHATALAVCVERSGAGLAG